MRCALQTVGSRPSTREAGVSSGQGVVSRTSPGIVSEYGGNWVPRHVRNHAPAKKAPMTQLAWQCSRSVARPTLGTPRCSAVTGCSPGNDGPRGRTHRATSPALGGT